MAAEQRELEEAAEPRGRAARGRVLRVRGAVAAGDDAVERVGGPGFGRREVVLVRHLGDRQQPRDVRGGRGVRLELLWPVGSWWCVPDMGTGQTGRRQRRTDVSRRECQTKVGERDVQIVDYGEKSAKPLHGLSVQADGILVCTALHVLGARQAVGGHAEHMLEGGRVPAEEVPVDLQEINHTEQVSERARATNTKSSKY